MHAALLINEISLLHTVLKSKEMRIRNIFQGIPSLRTELICVIAPDSRIHINHQGREMNKRIFGNLDSFKDIVGRSLAGSNRN